MARKVSFSYYRWISQRLKEAELNEKISELVGLLNVALRDAGSDLQIASPQVFQEVPLQMEDIKKGPTGDVAGKIALMNPIGFLLARMNEQWQPDKNVSAIAVVLRPEVPSKGPDPKSVRTYRSQFYVNKKKAGNKTLAEMRGSSLAFGSPHSTSNFLVPAAHLQKKGLHPLSAFKRMVFAGGHEDAAIAVYKGEADVGAGHDGVIVDLASSQKHPEYKDAKDVLHTIEWSEEIPSDPVVMNAPEDIRQAVLNALLKVAPRDRRDSPGNKVVESFWGTPRGFEAIPSEDYNVLKNHMTLFSLKHKDVMK